MSMSMGRTRDDGSRSLLVRQGAEVIGRARLAGAVQAVEVDVLLEGRSIRAVIAGSVFETRFSASGGPQAWVESYYENQSAIESAVQRKAVDHPDAAVIVLLERDFGSR